MDFSKLSTRELHLIRTKMWNASMSNHAKYLNAETLLFDEKYVEFRSCPACGQAEAAFIFQKSGGCYVKCPCSMIYLNPVFKREYLEKYYSENHSVQSEIVENDSYFYKSLYSQGLKMIESVSSTHENILDVGCSSGVFLDLAKVAGWNTHGIEFNKMELLHTRKKGHPVLGEGIESARFENKMNAITLWDVFEHIPNGVEFFRNAAERLAKNGLVFIQSPQSLSLAARILQAKCNMYDGLEHVNLYNLETLTRVAIAADYEVVAFSTVIPELGVLDNFINYDDPYLGPSNNKETFLNLISDKEILAKNLGYKFQAVLRKK